MPIVTHQPTRPPRNEERYDHEHKARETVLEDQCQLVTQQHPCFAEDVDLHTLRQRRTGLIGPIVQRLCGGERIGLGSAQESHLDGGASVALHLDLMILGTPYDLRDAAELNQAAFVGQIEMLETEAVALLIDAAKLTGAVAATDASGGNIAALAPDFHRQLVEGHVKLGEALARHHDGELFGGKSVETNVFYSPRTQLGFELPHQGYELEQRAVARHQHVCNALHVDVAADPRRLDVRGQVAHVRDPLLRLIQGQLHVGVMQEFQE